MPLHCPRCQIAQAEENKTCINCGQPLTAARAVPATTKGPLAGPALLAEAAAPPADHDDPTVTGPVHVVPARTAPWRLPALIAVGLLFALMASALLVARHKQAGRPAPAAPIQAQTPDAVPPAPGDVPLSPAAPAAGAKPIAEASAKAETAAGTMPLTITLASTSEGRHVNVGEDVTFTAFTALARGRSATLTLFYRRGRGRKTMFSFAQGSLCSTTWTPSVPGRYEFMATALGDRQQVAASRRVEITVDKPAAPPPPRPVSLPPPRTVPTRAVPPRAVPPRTVPPRAVPPRTVPPRTVPPRTVPRAMPPAPALTYYVAAARFSVSRSAVVLAEALSHRGYRAVPERMADRRGKPVYVVVTGSYRRPREARSAVLDLQRSGYPAYFFSSR